MKKQVLFLTLIGILFSCNNNDDAINLETNIVGSWELIQMSGSVPNSETTGIEMEWQEIYQLNIDGTFQKSRERDGIKSEASGTYTLINNSNETTLELNFTSENEIIGSCTSATIETMNLESNNIFSSTWYYCDGPGLKYEKLD